MKLYLAGPMTGVKDFNFPAFHAAAADLRSRGHHVFNPAEADESTYGKVFQSETGEEADLPEGFDFRQSFNADLSWICLEAEGIALLKGWEKSEGAQVEYRAARRLGLEIYVQDTFGWRPVKKRDRKHAAK